MSLGTNEDLYAILGVRPDASAAQIDAAWKIAIRRVHPDTAPGGGISSENAFRTRLAAQLNSAHTTLSNPAKRAVYDLDRAAAVRAAPTSRPAPPRPAPPRPGPVYPPPRQARPAYTPPPPVRKPFDWQAEPPAYSTPEPPNYERVRSEPSPAWADDLYFDASNFRPTKNANGWPIGPPHGLADFFLHHRIGQWLLVVTVTAIAYLAALTFDPAEPAIFTMRITIGFIVAFGIVIHSLATPAGDILRVTSKLVDDAIGRSGTGSSTMGRRR
jgi:hypothetical protein